MKCRILLSGLLILSVAGWIGLATGQEATTGSIVGEVTDPEGNPLAGATVSIASNQGTKTALTELDGGFRFLYLTPGIYDLTAAFPGYITAACQDIEVRLLARVRIEAVLTPGASETIEVVGSAPTIDLSSTTTGATISSAMMSSIPLGRTFSSTLAMAPNVVEGGIDNSNPSIAGASGLENTYIVDGMSIGNTGYGSAGSYSIVYGSLGTGVNYDYIHEVQVKTGGFEPEYGEALGGFINLVTKSGTNEFTGSVFSYVQVKDLEADRVTSDHWLLSARAASYASRDYGFDVGGPIVRDKAFWFAAFDPTFTTATLQTSTAVSDAQGFNHTIERNRTVYNYAANLKWLVSPKHTLAFSTFGDPSVGEYGPQRSSALAVSDPSTRYSEITYGGHNVVGHWNGELFSNWFIEGTLAYHEDKFEEDPGLDTPQGFDFRGGVFRRCGGVGFYENNTSTNTQYQLKFSNYLQAAGEHHIRYGVNHQDIGYEEASNFTGPEGIEIELADGRTVTSTSGYSWEVDADSTYFVINRIRSGDLGAETSADYTAAFISDTWSPTDYLSIMGGVRYEQEKLEGNVTSFTWKDNWSPRFHLTLDPLRDNRTKLFFAYGRYFGKVPNDLAVRAMSREVSYVVVYDYDQIDLSDPDNPQNINPQAQIDGLGPFVLGDSQTRIDPDAKLSYADEFIVGAEREVIPFLTVGLTYLHRELGRTLEDVQEVAYSELLAGADFGEYVITNPGAPLFPEPKRDYDAVTLKVEKRLRDNWQLLASYTWSQLRGNYEGYFRRDNGQSDPFITSAFDFPYLLDPEIWQYTSASGPLPSDRPHVFSAAGSYRLGNGLDIGLRLRIQSGTPITKLGYNYYYASESEILLEERGASGRTPTTKSVGLHLGYPIAIPEGIFGLGIEQVEASIDIFNLLNEQEEFYVDTMAEVGGSVQGPPYSPTACPSCANPDFGKAYAFQGPRQIRFALRARF
ncbi:MAG: TonB-dependent receptor [Candidatus Eisenbacteria sp.]|nr:TonB-dependent receptor [Candidatus Eisenbacteria bacterium]